MRTIKVKFLSIMILALMYITASGQVYQDLKKYSSTYTWADTIGHGPNAYYARNNSLYAKTDSMWFKMGQDSSYHGLQVTIKMKSENTGPATFNYNNLGNKEIHLASSALTGDRKSTRLNSSHSQQSRMPSSA